MKKRVLFVLIAVVAAALAACGSGETSTVKADDDKNLKLGATAGPYSDMLKKAIQPGLEE